MDGRTPWPFRWAEFDSQDYGNNPNPAPWTSKKPRVSYAQQASA